MDYQSLFGQQCYFEFHRVDASSEHLFETFRLRYQVYCLERGFLSAEDYPQSFEQDEYDGHAEHFSAHDRQGELAGSVRLVRHSPELGYPFQTHCPIAPGLELPPPEEAQEISRLVVSKAYRRRREDNWIGINDADTPVPADIAAKRGGHPIIVLGLYRAMFAYSRANGVRYWYAAMERSLARLLGRYGFDFTPIGPEVDYYGPVAVYLADLRKLEARVSAENPALFKWFCATD
ncbi:MAG: PEP-CTERM/exosortase system-associated acyltransferase [Pseudomonadota bacterium]